MKRPLKGNAFTLVELLVVIAIIGTLVGLLLPAVQSAREASRSNTCRVHLTELTRALTMYQDNNEIFPGYVETIQNAATTTQLSWIGTILPYIEQQSLYDQLIGRDSKASTSLALVVCPSNPADVEGAPVSSYLVNAGWIQNEREHDPSDCQPLENIANGVFFDRTRSSDSNQDIRDLDPMCHNTALDPMYKVSMATVQAKGDGTTRTLMLSEGINALYWTYVGGISPNKKWDFGFCWEQPSTVREAYDNSTLGDLETGPGRRVVNGVRERIAGATIGSKTVNTAFPSSFHPGGVNVAFVGSQVQFLKENIDAFVFAQLMTSNHKHSDLRYYNGKKEREVEQPGAEDY